MALISIKRNVDLQPGLNAPAVFNCSQSDKGTTIMLGLMNGGNDYTVPSGVTITIRGSRSNGAVFTPVSATSSGSTVSFTLTEEMTDTAGPTLCEAVLEQGNNVLGTANFIINVEGSPMGADVPPVFTDAAWTWMLGKLTTETVPALGDDVISSIQGKVDKSQGSTNAKKFLRVNTSGNVSLASTDKTLSVADQIADAKETGDQIRALDAEIDGVATTLGGSISTLNGITTDLQSSKLNKSQGTSNAGKTMVVDSSGNIVPGDVPITIDDTLSIADAAADAKAAGDAIALKANASTIAPEFSGQSAYTAGSYVYKNGVLYRFTSNHTAGAWTGTDAEVVTVVGEVGELNNITHRLTESSALTFSNAYLYRAIIGASTGVWYASGTAYYGYILPVPENAVRITVTANENQYAVFAPLKTSAHEIGTAPDYIDGPNGKRMIISAGETYSFAVSGCNYLWVLQKDQTNVDPTPESIMVTTLKDIVYANDLDNKLIETEVLELSDINIKKYTSKQIAIGVNNKWSTSGSSFFIPVSDFFGTYLSVTSHATNGSVICFLRSNSYVSGNAVAYANGTVRNSIPAGETREFEIPSDCTYINVLNYWSNDFVPQSFKVYLSTVSKIKDEILTNDRIGLTWDNWESSYCITAHFYSPSSPYASLQGNRPSASNVLKASSFIPLYGKMLELPMIWVSDSTYVTYGMSLYDKDRNPIPGRAICSMALRGENDPRYYWARVYIPENAKYFRTTYWADDSQPITEGLAPTFSYNLLKEIPDECKPITHELPVDTYMQNTIRRARQLTDIKWTPRVNIPRYSMMDGSDVHFLDWFYADHEYTGIPYSGAGKREGSSSGWTAPEEWGYAHNWVGGCIPFEAFVTAARYPNSIFSETTGQSAPDYDSSPFGIVCTGLVNYSVNGPWPLRAIRDFFSTSDGVFQSTRKTVAAFDDFMIGDFLYTEPHVIIITDIRRDKDGNITHVEMSEATTVGNGNNAILGSKLGGVARRKMWKYEEFKTRYYAYTVFRRKTFYGIPYYPSKYVDTGNEGDQKNIVDYPCIPYLGNGAIYREGYIHNSKILIGATGFTSLVVTKDGTEFGTFDITGLTEVEVGFSTVGSYEAYLTNGTSRTMACTWTVVEGTM